MMLMPHMPLGQMLMISLPALVALPSITPAIMHILSSNTP
jgi:hypothetical protein